MLWAVDGRKTIQTEAESKWKSVQARVISLEWLRVDYLVVAFQWGYVGVIT